jgi:hypothetical protein
VFGYLAFANVFALIASVVFGSVYAVLLWYSGDSLTGLSD